MSYIGVLNRKYYDTLEYYKNKIDKEITEGWIFLELSQDCYLWTFELTTDLAKIRILLSYKGKARSVLIDNKPGICDLRNDKNILNSDK